MNTEYNETNLGDISVNNEVIKNIALKAATDTPGIHRITKGLMKRIWNLLTGRGSVDGVKLEFTRGGTEVKITLKLMIEYGVNIPYAAWDVQENVKKAVETMTGLAVSEVAVRITEIQAKKAKVLKETSKKMFEETVSVSDELTSEG